MHSLACWPIELQGNLLAIITKKSIATSSGGDWLGLYYLSAVISLMQIDYLYMLADKKATAVQKYQNLQCLHYTVKAENTDKFIFQQ